MKRRLLLSGLLIVLDQLIKIIIWNFYMGSHIVLIPKILFFEPYQNTNLNWLASMADVVMPVFIMVILQIVVAICITLFYKSQFNEVSSVNKWLGLGYSMILAGVGCSFIDVVFWGGSVDYVGLFSWFIFDLKDVFLQIGWISIAIWSFLKEKNK